MICTSLQNKTYGEILSILEDPAVEMAEIRLDRCPLSDEEIEALFADSDTPLIATCRIAESPSPEEAERRLRLAIEAEGQPGLPQTELPIARRDSEGYVFLSIRVPEGGEAA